MTQHNASLLLIGLRGSGKSTLGRALAMRDGRSFVDLDDVTLASLGAQTVREAWAAHGEDAFRLAEVDALRAAIRDAVSIIALGGGTPTAPGAAEVIGEARQRGCAVTAYLRCTPGELRARLREHGKDDNRPSLTGGDALDEIETVYARRDELYRRLADRVIEGIVSLDDALGRFDGWQAWVSDEEPTA